MLPKPFLLQKYFLRENVYRNHLFRCTPHNQKERVMWVLSPCRDAAVCLPLWLLTMTVLGQAQAQAQQQQQQERVCVTGYPMDNFCIQLGNLLDNGLPTLGNPDRHTIHCLVDVGQCRNSGYEILAEPRDANGNFRRAYDLDSRGNELVLQEARKVGDFTCYTCDGTGNQRRGFQATFVGTVDPDYTGSPPLLRVEEIHPHTTDCATLLMQQVPAQPSASPVTTTPTGMEVPSASPLAATPTGMEVPSASPVTTTPTGMEVPSASPLAATPTGMEVPSASPVTTTPPTRMEVPSASPVSAMGDAPSPPPTSSSGNASFQPAHLVLVLVGFLIFFFST